MEQEDEGWYITSRAEVMSASVTLSLVNKKNKATLPVHKWSLLALEASLEKAGSTLVKSFTFDNIPIIIFSASKGGSVVHDSWRWILIVTK
jgi:hypothetical protein